MYNHWGQLPPTCTPMAHDSWILEGHPGGHSLEHALERSDSCENWRAACGRPVEAEVATVAAWVISGGCMRIASRSSKVLAKWEESTSWSTIMVVSQ